MPTYKADNYIESNINQFITHLDAQKRPYELIVIVDGYLDNTFSTVKTLEKKYKQLKVFGYPHNQGKGYAVRFGLTKAKNDYIGYIDAGADIDYSSISYMIAEINNYPHIDGFIADKTHPASKLYNAPFIRKIYSKVFNKFTNFLLDSHFTDTQVGLKLFKREAIQNVIFNIPIGINRFAFDVEIMQELFINKATIKRCPVIIQSNGRKTTVRYIDILIMIKDIFALSLYYHFEPLQNVIFPHIKKHNSKISLHIPHYQR